MQNPPRPALPLPGEKWTPDHVRAFLMYSDKAIGQALLALLARQTPDERASMDTKHVNNRGFSSYHAMPMTGMAKDYRAKGHLTGGQLWWLRGCAGKSKTPRICTYAAQLAEVANASLKYVTPKDHMT